MLPKMTMAVMMVFCANCVPTIFMTHIWWHTGPALLIGGSLHSAVSLGELWGYKQ